METGLLETGVCINLQSPTLSILSSNLEKLYRQSKDSKVKEEIRLRAQRDVEKKLVTSALCSTRYPELVENLSWHLFSFEEKILITYLEEFAGAEFHRNLSCLLDSCLNNSSTDSTVSERFTYWFSEVIQIGEESVEGYVLKASLKEAPLFVIKVARDPDEDNLMHEALVGLYATNQIRSYLPNFMYVYTRTECSAPFFDGKSVQTICSSRGNTPYLILENIRDAVPFKEFIQTCSHLEFNQVFFATLNAVRLAFNLYDFTHYDFHGGNVLVKFFPQLVALPIYNDSLEIDGYLLTHYVPYIIDYGNAHVNLNGYSFGKIGFEKFSVSDKQAFPMHDVYKLVCWLGFELFNIRKSTLTSENREIFKELETIFSFFEKEESFISRLQRKVNRRDWFDLPEEKWREVKYADLFSWLQEHGLFMKLSKEVPNSALLFQDTLKDSCDFFESFTSTEAPKTCFEYQEAHQALLRDTNLSPEEKKEALTWLDSHFNAYTVFKSKIVQVLEEAQNLETAIKNVSIPKANAEMKEDETWIANYISICSSLAEIKVSTLRLITFLRSTTYALNAQSSLEEAPEVKQLSSRLKQIILVLNRLRRRLHENQRTMRKSLLPFWRRQHPRIIASI